MKKAFTLLELIFVIIVVSVISLVAVNKFNVKELSNGVDVFIKDFNYTRHLAIIDNEKIFDKEDDSKTPFWAIKILGKGEKYSIFKHDKNDHFSGGYGNEAVDYTDKTKVLALNKIDGEIKESNKTTADRVFLKKTYGIENIQNSPGNRLSCDGFAFNTFLFDSEGVPYIANTNSTKTTLNITKEIGGVMKLKEPCTIKIKRKNNITCVKIYPQTAYTQIVECGS